MKRWSYYRAAFVWRMTDVSLRLPGLCGVRVLLRDVDGFRHWGYHRSHHGRSICLGRNRLYWWWR